MVLIPKHPLPWHSAGVREIGDADGNVVQYTQDTIGAICLAVNSHDNMRNALLQLRPLVTGDAAAIIDAALGKIGLAVISATLEAANGPSGDLDALIATELQRPQMAFTGSLDAAMTLIPAGWRVAWSTAPSMIVTAELTSPDGGKAVTASCASIPLAICSASLMAMEG
jgi:hypothetical protein